MTEITNHTFMLQEAQEKARSFPTLKPPNQAVYLGSVKKNNNTYNYYVDGELVKLAALPFGDKVLAFDKDGNIISKETEIDGEKYLPSTEELIAGVPFATIKK